MIDFNSDFGRAVQRHLKEQSIVWLTTVDSTLTPQPRPVWFVYEDDSFLIFSQAHAHKVAHIQKHPRVSLNFNTDESGDKHVIVLTGEAVIDADCPPAHEVPTYFEKYREDIAGLDMTPDDFSHDYSVAIRIRPTELRGWE
jgi:PPOX class probable F420-dependent enzyme